MLHRYNYAHWRVYPTMSGSRSVASPHLLFRRNCVSRWSAGQESANTANTANRSAPFRVSSCAFVDHDADATGDLGMRQADQQQEHRHIPDGTSNEHANPSQPAMIALISQHGSAEKGERGTQDERADREQAQDR
jgi:hypothetical protein